MPEITHRTLQAGSLPMRVAECGAGPTIILCHGFPESWYSWRHQLQALAAVGFHVVAPDMRGYGGTDAPREIAQYTLLHLVGDMVGLLDALGVAQAVIAGHDWGAPVAWHAGLFRPDRFRAVIALSVPFRPWSPVPPTSVMPQTDSSQFYQLYFQTPGLAEAELDRDPGQTIRRVLVAVSGEGSSGAPVGPIGMVPRAGGFLANMPDPPSLPPWLSEADIAVYASEFARTGFRGGLNWYRNIDRNWELLAAFAGSKVTVPALFVAGDRDLVLRFRGMDQVMTALPTHVPQLRRTLILPGCGHWTQQERPEEVNAAIIGFLQSL